MSAAERTFTQTELNRIVVRETSKDLRRQEKELRAEFEKELARARAQAAQEAAQQTLAALGYQVQTAPLTSAEEMLDVRRDNSGGTSSPTGSRGKAPGPAADPAAESAASAR